MNHEKKTWTFPVTGQLLQCNACKRKILVQRVLLGIDHDMQVAASCWDCLSKEVQKKCQKMYKLEKEVGKEEGI